MVSEEVIVKVRDFLILVKEQIPVESAYLFGSYVNGSPRPDSDIDVGIFTENPDGTYMEILKKLFKKRRSIDSRFNVQCSTFSVQRSVFKNPGLLCYFCRSEIKDFQVLNL